MAGKSLRRQPVWLQKRRFIQIPTRSGNMIFLMTKTNLEFQLSELLLMTCIQQKGLKKTYQKGKGSLAGGVQDLRVKLSGIAYEQQDNTDLPKSKPKELAKLARKSVAVDFPMAEAACLMFVMRAFWEA